MLRVKRGIFVMALLLVACSILAYSQLPQVGRRPLKREEAQRVLNDRGEVGQLLVNSLQAGGVAGNLTDQELETFRQRGVDEFNLFFYLDEFGITPPESDALKRVGVDLEFKFKPGGQPLRRPPAIGFWAALADVVCIGNVSQKRGTPEGPYHTYVDIEPIEYLKNLKGPQGPILQTRILHSGPRYDHEGKLVHTDDRSEPDLRPGEKVIIFLTSKPWSLINLLAQAEATGFASNPLFERQYAPAQAIRALINVPGPYEVLAAWKIVGNKAVTKLRGYRIPNETDVISLSQARQMISNVVAAQRPFRR